MQLVYITWVFTNSSYTEVTLKNPEFFGALVYITVGIGGLTTNSPLVH